MKMRIWQIGLFVLHAACNHNSMNPGYEGVKTFYINGWDAKASDSNSGLSASWDSTTKSGPFKTISRAMSLLEPGDVAYVRAGVYAESGLRFSHSGEKNAAITLSAYATDTGFESVVIDGSGAAAGTNGILIDRDQNFIVLKGLEIRNMPNAGIATDESTRHRGIVIENAVVRGNGVGIGLSKTDEFKLTSVRACENAEEGIRLISSNNGSITNSEACRNQAGFHLIASSNNRLEGNSATGNGVAGFVLESNSNNNTLRENVSGKNQAEDGFTIAGSYGNLLTGNEAYGNGKRGMQFTDQSQNNRIENNLAHDNGVLGFAIYVESIKNTLRANTSHSNRFHGFVFLAGASENTVTENRSYDNCRSGFYFENANKNEFLDNRAYDNGFDGFTMFLGSDGNHFLNNTAERNTGWGFLSDFDSPNDSLATGNSALLNSAGQFGEVAFESIDFAAYTDISNPWDCR
ncbi:MAG: nitrous oxide reductase family maturation protein NosD [bacterium]